MNKNETEAILGYLEFHLVRFVEDIEKHVSDPDVVAGMYDRAYSVLNDFEQTLAAQLEIERAVDKPTQSK